VPKEKIGLAAGSAVGLAAISGRRDVKVVILFNEVKLQSELYVEFVLQDRS